jgi:hypothetical protein
VLSIVQTIALIVTSLAAAYSIVLSEKNRRLDARRARIERLLDVVLNLVGAAAHAHVNLAEGLPAMDAARRRLSAELEVVGVKGYESTELMVREGKPALEILDQGRAAVIEIGRHLDQLAAHRSLLRIRPKA